MPAGTMAVVASPAARPYRSAETRAIADRMRGLGSEMLFEREQAMDEILVRPLVAAGPWAKLGGLYIPSHAIPASVVNFRAPAGPVLTPTNSPTIVADRYFQGDGATSWFDTGINPVTAGGNFTLNSSSLFVWSLTDSDANQSEIGSGSNTRLLARSGGTIIARSNNGGNQTRSTSDSLGLIGWSRTSATSIIITKGGDVGSPLTTSSASISSGNVGLCRGGTTLWSTRPIAAAGFGGALTSDDWSALNTILGNWLTYIGAI